MRADGSIACAGAQGSIHKIGAHVQGALACNGWTFWHYEAEGRLKPIDALREAARAKLAAAGLSARLVERVQQDLPHHARQRGAGKLARLQPAAALGLGGTLRLCVAPDLGAIDVKLQMEMREGVLDQPGQFPPVGLERRVVARLTSRSAPPRPRAMTAFPACRPAARAAAVRAAARHRPGAIATKAMPRRSGRSPFSAR